jgi:hypothetical protein
MKQDLTPGPGHPGKRAAHRWFTRISEDVIIKKVVYITREGAASVTQGLFDDLIA